MKMNSLCESYYVLNLNKKKEKSMSRSLWKGPFIDYSLLRLFTKLKNQDQKASENPVNLRLRRIRLWSRRSIILPEYLDQTFEIHNGKQFIQLQVMEDMIGHRFGEFASTRKKTVHKKKTKK